MKTIISKAENQKRIPKVGECFNIRNDTGKKHVCVVEVVRFNDPLYLQKNMNYNKMVIQQSI